MNIIRNEPTAYRIGLNQYLDDRQPYISLLFPVVLSSSSDISGLFGTL